MNRYMQVLPEYVSQSILGREFGVSSHIIGRWLTALGLRVDGIPTAIAIAEGYAMVTPIPWITYRSYWVWHKQRTITALLAAGHPRKGVA